MRITASSRTRFKAWWAIDAGADRLPLDDELWAGMIRIAKAFHFPPSEIDGLDFRDFLEWVRRC